MKLKIFFVNVTLGNNEYRDFYSCFEYLIVSCACLFAFARACVHVKQNTALRIRDNPPHTFICFSEK